jgi:hypothetical protein
MTTSELETFEVDARFCGPPDSGNGGYVAGRLARYIEGPAAVRLKLPPPLGVVLRVVPDDEGVLLMQDDVVIATARPTHVELEVPPPPSSDETRVAEAAFRGWDYHVFPGCFVCGTERGEADGLRIFTGPLAGRPGVAAHWTPDASLGDEDGIVADAFVWSALDCPGAFSFPQPKGRAVVLGELAVAIEAQVRIGEVCTLLGWEVDHQGRKHLTGTALFGEDERRCAVSQGTWIEIPLPS